MTKEERIQKMSENLDSLDTLVKEYNVALSEDRGVSAISQQINDIIDTYTGYAWANVVEEIAASENPMLTAVTLRTYTTIATKLEKIEGTNGFLTIEAKEKAIDLLKLNKATKIGANRDWPYLMEAFNCAMTARTAIDILPDDATDEQKSNLIKSIKSNYHMSGIAKSIVQGNDLTTNSKLLKSLQELVAHMMGDGYKALSHDIKYLFKVYTRKGKEALKVSCANNSNFCKYIAEICYRIAVGGEYSVDYKTIKK